MSTAGLTIALAVGFGLLALVLNHCYARIALVELTLNEGLPPGHEPAPPSAGATARLDPADTLDLGVHIFLSRTCHACQRLVEELESSALSVAAPLQLHYVDRPRPVARAAATKHDAVVHEHQTELATGLGADPLPYAIAIGEHQLVGRSVAPTLAQVLSTAHDAGIKATIGAT